jgi:hypothetical protein
MKESPALTCRPSGAGVPAGGPSGVPDGRGHADPLRWRAAGHAALRGGAAAVPQPGRQPQHAGGVHAAQVRSACVLTMELMMWKLCVRRTRTDSQLQACARQGGGTEGSTPCSLAAGSAQEGCASRKTPAMHAPKQTCDIAKGAEAASGWQFRRLVCSGVQLRHGVMLTTAHGCVCRWDSPMEAPPGVDPSKIGVGQWVPGVSFGEFSRRTFDKYYS